MLKHRMINMITLCWLFPLIFFFINLSLLTTFLVHEWKIQFINRKTSHFTVHLFELVILSLSIRMIHRNWRNKKTIDWIEFVTILEIVHFVLIFGSFVKKFKKHKLSYLWRILFIFNIFLLIYQIQNNFSTKVLIENKIN